MAHRDDSLATWASAREARGRLEPGLDIGGVCARCVVFEFERLLEPETQECGSIFGKTGDSGGGFLWWRISTVDRD